MGRIHDPEDLVICRCEGVTLPEIRSCLRKGEASSPSEVRKLTRAGMGLCQGRTCFGLLELMLKEDGAVFKQAALLPSRPPVRPVALKFLAAGAEVFKEPASPVSVVMLRQPRPDQPGE